MRTLIAAAVLALAAAAGGPAFAGDPMSSASHLLLRSDVNGGGDASSSSNNKLEGAFAADAGDPRTSTTYRMVPGAMALFSFPSTIGDLSAPDPRLSSATLKWSAPYYDSAIGANLMSGSSYLVRVASYTSPYTFSLQYATLVSTGATGTTPGAFQARWAASLDPNTTWFASVWTMDADGNVSLESNRSTFTTLARLPVALASTYLNVYETSATLAWAAIPVDVASATAEGFSLEASTTDFGNAFPGGTIYSSATTNVLSSTLTVSLVDLGTTYYFRVGSLNWTSIKHYAALPKLNFEVLQSSSGLSFGSIDARSVQSVVATSSIVVTNRGTLPMTYRVLGATVTPGGSEWALASSSGTEQFVLQAVWNSGSSPPADTAFVSPILTSTQTSGGAGGLFAGDQTGVSVPPGESRTMWFRFWRPATTVRTDKQTIRVDVRPTYP